MPLVTLLIQQSDSISQSRAFQSRLSVFEEAVDYREKEVVMPIGGRDRGPRIDTPI